MSHASSPAALNPVFGRLSLESFPIHEPILIGTFAVVALLGVGILGLMFRFRLWGWLWREWLTSVDHKKIGVMYLILGIVMLLRGFADALMMRLQQSIDSMKLAWQSQYAGARPSVTISASKHSARRKSSTSKIARKTR